MAPSTATAVCTRDAAAPDGPPPAPTHPTPRRFAARLVPAYESFFSTVSTDDPLPPGYPAARTFGNPSGTTIDTGLEGRAGRAEQDDDPAAAALYRHCAARDTWGGGTTIAARDLGLGPGVTPRAAARTATRGMTATWTAERWERLWTTGVRLHEGGAGRAGGAWEVAFRTRLGRVPAGMVAGAGGQVRLRVAGGWPYNGGATGCESRRAPEP